MSKLDEESRAELGKELSKIYFDGSNSEFNERCYFYAISTEMRIVDTIGDFKFNSDGTDDRERKWRHSINDVEVIIKKSIDYIKGKEKLNETLIPTYQLIETNLNGKSFYPQDIGPLPVPEDELPGQLFFSNTHYIQSVLISSDNKYNYYLRDMQNEYFFRTLYIINYKYQQPDGGKGIDYSVLGRMEHGNMIIVGIHAYNKWELSLLISDDKFESNKLMDGGRKILNSAVDINIDQVQEKANSSLKEKAIKDIEQKGFIVKDNNLFQSLGGDPRILSDSEFEMVYGEPRD